MNTQEYFGCIPKYIAGDQANTLSSKNPRFREEERSNHCMVAVVHLYFLIFLKDCLKTMWEADRAKSCSPLAMIFYKDIYSKNTNLKNSIF